MNAPCLSCGHSEMRPLRPYRTNRRYARAVFRDVWLHECRRCGLAQAVPLPNGASLADYYTLDHRRGGRGGSDVADIAQFPKDNLYYFNRGQSVAELLVPYVRGEHLRILDIGAGYGHILHFLGERYPNSKRVAVELSAECVKFLERLGVKVFAEPAEAVLPRMQRQFDVVILSHVLEHLLDPLPLS